MRFPAIRSPAVLFALLLFAYQPLLGQTQRDDKNANKEENKKNSSPPSVFEIKVGPAEGWAYSYFLSPKTAEQKTDAILLNLSVVGSSDWQLEGGIESFQRDLQKTSFDVFVKAPTLSVKLVKTDVLLLYSGYRNKEDIFASNQLTVKGRSRKDFILVGVGSGLGNIRRSYFRVYFWAGGSYAVNNADFYNRNGQLINPDENDFGKDALPMFGPGANASLLFFDRLNIRFDGKHVQAVGNRLSILAPEAYIFRGEIKMFLTKNIGISVLGRYADDSRSLIFNNKSVAVLGVVRLDKK